MTRLLLVSQLRFLRRSPWSAATVLLGVALGVSSVVAVHQVNLRVNQSLAAATPVHLAGISHLLERAEGFTRMEDYVELRRGWRAGELPDVSALIPVVEGRILHDQRATLIFASDWLAAWGLPATESMRARASLVGRDVVVADTTLGLAQGDVVSLGGVACEVVALVDTGLGPAVFADIGTGVEILGQDPERLSYVALARVDRWAWLKDVLEQALPGSTAGLAARGGWQMAGWRVRPVGAELPTVEFARSILFNLGALGTLTMVVAWFLIHQVAVVWFRQRRPLMQRLSVLGVSRSVLHRDFVLSFALIGLLATGLGLALGPSLADALNRMDNAHVGPPVGVWVVLKALVSGVGVSALGAWMACRESPWRLGPRIVVLVVLALCVSIGVWFDVTGLVGAFTAVLGMCLLAVLSVRPVLSRLKRVAPAAFGSLLVRLGVRQVLWYPVESSVAIGALALAVGASMGIGMMVESFRGDFQRMLEARLAHELFVTADGRSLEAAYQWLRGQAPDAQVQAYGRARYRIGDWTVLVGYTDFNAAESARYGYSGALDDGQALVSERLARLLGAAPGDRLPTPVPLMMVGLFPGYGEPGLRLLVDTSTARGMGIDPLFDRLSVARLSPGVLEDWTRTFPWLQVQSRGEMRALALDVFDRTFAITRSLTLLSLLVAAIGVYNALAALRLNQLHSERLLVVLGTSRGERAAITLGRAFAVGAAALVLALPLGLGMAALLCEVVNPRAFGWSLRLAPSLFEIALPMALAGVAVLLAGSLPAPRGEQAHAEVEGV